MRTHNAPTTHTVSCVASQAVFETEPIHPAQHYQQANMPSQSQNHKFETQEKHKAFTAPLVVNRFLAAGSESASTVWERLLDREDGLYVHSTYNNGEDA